MNPPDWLLPVITIIFGGGGPLVAWLAYRNESKKLPIERRTAKVAEATSISTVANEILQTVFERMKTQDERAEAQDERIRGLRQELAQVNQRLDKINFTWRTWYLDLRDEWDFHRTKDEAPPAPITEGL